MIFRPIKPAGVFKLQMKITTQKTKKKNKQNRSTKIKKMLYLL